MKIIKKIYKNLDRREKKSGILVLFFIVTLLILDFLSIGLIFPLVSSIFNNQFFLDITQKSFFIGWKKNQLIYFFLGLILIAFLLKNIVFLVFNYQKKKILAKIQFNFSSRIFIGYISQNYSEFLKKEKSELLRNTSLVNEYTYVMENFITLFIEVLILFFIFSLVILTNTKIGFILIFFIIAIAIIVSKVSFKRLSWYGKNINVQSKKLLDNYLNIFGSIREIILSKKQNFFNESFKKELNINLENEVKSGFFLDIPRTVIEVSLIMLLSIVIFLNMEQSENYDLFLTDLAFLGALIFRAMPSVSKIMHQASGISLKYNKILIVNDIISNLRKEKLIDQEVIDEKKIIFSSLEFKNLSFAYEENKNILENVNLKINKNETIGIYSKSGSGKSTLLDLMSGLISPTQGSVIINEALQLNKEMAPSFQKIIGYISQNNFLLNDSIKKNITFGLEEDKIDYQKLDEVIKLSKLKEFVDSKNENFNFKIEDNGKNISGGQRQRIILARSMYKNSQLLLLDEPTSSLDADTESEIMTDIEDQFNRKKTLIICSHNWELLKFCEKIYTIRDKKVITLENK